jgi:hypothetical protein
MQSKSIYFRQLAEWGKEIDFQAIWNMLLIIADTQY